MARVRAHKRPFAAIRPSGRVGADTRVASHPGTGLVEESPRAQGVSDVTAALGGYRTVTMAGGCLIRIVTI
jgi:hypothetical protein